jgi:peptidoglycan hydrolase-like protein with peptidoglycan-binding domain
VPAAPVTRQWSLRAHRFWFVPALLALACGQPAPGAAPAAVPVSTTSVVRTDVASRQSVGGMIAYAGSRTVTALVDGGSYTWLPPAGSVIERGRRLYEVSGRAVTLLFGERPAWRRLAPGVSGPDVRQLEDNLITLGFATGQSLAADGNFVDADAAAVRRWQGSLGVLQTGVVDLGDVVFLPAAMRVVALHAALGSPVQPGSPILEMSSTQKLVIVQLDTAYENLVRPGDGVSITLPDNRSTTTGTVSEVGSVASAPGGQSGQGGPPARPAVPLQVDVPDQAALAGYDQAPVRVSITDQVHKNVLAVPITALLAEGDGGYAVRVVHGARSSLLRVQLGIFSDDGMVEVGGEGLHAGLQVQVPRT